LYFVLRPFRAGAGVFFVFVGLCPSLAYVALSGLALVFSSPGFARR